MDGLVVVSEHAHEFEAEVLAAVLRDEGIDATVARNPLTSALPVQRQARLLVHEADLPRAREVLSSHSEPPQTPRRRPAAQRTFVAVLLGAVVVVIVLAVLQGLGQI